MLTTTAPEDWRAISPVSSVTRCGPHWKVLLTLLNRLIDLLQLLVGTRGVAGARAAHARTAACIPGAYGHDGAMPFQRGSRNEPRWNDTAAPRWVPRSGIGARSSRAAERTAGLFAQAEFVNQCRVALGVVVLQVVQQLAATAHHLEQATPA